MEEEKVLSKENSELKEQFLDVFKSNEITLDSETLGVFNEVFADFDLASGIDDSINIYFKEDIVSFETDLTINNFYQVNVNGFSAGTYTATYTYCDNIEYITREKTDLIYNNEIVENLLDFPHKNERTKLVNPEEWCVIVTETLTWDSGEYNRVPRLYVYAPISGENIQ